MALSLKGLRALSDEELITHHDTFAKRTVLSLQYFIGEIYRREQEKQTRTMLRYTGWITLMTIIMTIATIVNVIVSFKLLSQ
jgi:hypothetical protein